MKILTASPVDDGDLHVVHYEALVRVEESLSSNIRDGLPDNAHLRALPFHLQLVRLLVTDVEGDVLHYEEDDRLLPDRNHSACYVSSEGFTGG